MGFHCDLFPDDFNHYSSYGALTQTSMLQWRVHPRKCEHMEIQIRPRLGNGEHGLH